MNDKTHDRHYQQHFIEREIRWLEDCLVRKRQEDVGKGKGVFPSIYRIFLHMDNVYQNFKITGGIWFVTNLFKERKMEDPTAEILIVFGCPGHRKDAWVSLQLLLCISSFRLVLCLTECFF